ncbi:MAG: ATP-binding protein [Oscillospiraceae bacterium]|jgi:tRNA 2-thiocytidine biosynthesis protein TtcA|nr:ATP-binding protein [Oscillospiraceae bacterium]
MQYISGLVRRCLEDYDMIAPNDHITVGLSGGKDSLMLLTALSALRAYYPVPYTLEAITLDMGIPGMDFSPLVSYCKQLEVPYSILPTQLYHVIFEVRNEKNPCSMCAKLRRGALNRTLSERGCHKIALGHHYDDAVETLLLSLLFEGRIHCFQPVTYLDRTEITQIRPLLYVGEALIEATAKRLSIPVIQNPCPANGKTKRQEVKELVSHLNETYPGIKQRVFGAMQRLPLDHWKPLQDRRRPLPE